MVTVIEDTPGKIETICLTHKNMDRLRLLARPASTRAAPHLCQPPHDQQRQHLDLAAIVRPSGSKNDNAIRMPRSKAPRGSQALNPIATLTVGRYQLHKQKRQPR